MASADPPTTMALSRPERELCELIAGRETDLLEQLRAHVAVPTGHGHEPGLNVYRAMMAERLSALGAQVSEMDGEPRPGWLDVPGSALRSGPPPPTLVARREGTGPRVLIVGHLDTVHDPHGSFQELAASPDGRTVVGPGAVDMKGGIVIALTALETLAVAGVQPSWTVLLNSDEETGSFCSHTTLRDEARRHDLGIVLEPALPGGALALERSGSGQFMVEVFGRAAHAGRAFTDGISAVVKLAEVIRALDSLARPDRGVIVNVGPLQGGRVTNTVPDHAAGWGNVRYPDAASGEELARALDGLATAGETLPRVIVQRSWNRPAKPATDAVRRFADATRAVAEDLGRSLEYASTGGVCDGNILQDAGLPTLDTLGVCGGNLHREDEYVETESLVWRCQMLAVLLARIADGRIEA